MATLQLLASTASSASYTSPFLSKVRATTLGRNQDYQITKPCRAPRITLSCSAATSRLCPASSLQGTSSHQSLPPSSTVSSKAYTNSQDTRLQRVQASSSGMLEPSADSGSGIPPRPPPIVTTGGGGGRGGGDGGNSGGRGAGGSEGDLPEEGPKGAWNKYIYLAEKYPIVTKSITAAILNTLADLLCQTVVERSPSIDLTRLLGFTAIGLFIAGPALHLWYGLLPRIINIPGDKGTLVRLALDQFIFSPVSMAFFFFIVLSLEGRPNQVVPKLKKDLIPTIINQWKLWIPFQFANFKFVPPALQVATASLLGLVWTVYMSLVTHSKDPEPLPDTPGQGGQSQATLASS